jgi:hypothetical protein
MDLWQLNQMRIIKRRVDDLTSIIFMFIAYEVGGILVVGVYLFFELAMRIYENSKRKNKKIRVNSSADADLVSDSQGVKL